VELQKEAAFYELRELEEKISEALEEKKLQKEQEAQASVPPPAQQTTPGAKSPTTPHSSVSSSKKRKSAPSSITKPHSSKKLRAFDRVFCITGDNFNGKSRRELQHLIKENGGTVLTNITDEVTHLICADPKRRTQKLVDAEKNDVVILSVEDIAHLL